MSVCLKCGACIEPGRPRCAACGQAGADDPAPHAETPVERIERKIAQTPFVRNERRWWGLRGGLVGLVVGFLVGVGFCLAGFGYGGLIGFGVVGCFTGMLAGLSVPVFWKPVWTAIFCDVRRFEREYGDRPVLPPRGNRRGPAGR
jgi:hypothetical protein